jgi:hypothetical protein
MQRFPPAAACIKPTLFSAGFTSTSAINLCILFQIPMPLLCMDPHAPETTGGDNFLHKFALQNLIKIDNYSRLSVLHNFLKESCLDCVSKQRFYIVTTYLDKNADCQSKLM